MLDKLKHHCPGLCVPSPSYAQICDGRHLRNQFVCVRYQEITDTSHRRQGGNLISNKRFPR